MISFIIKNFSTNECEVQYYRFSSVIAYSLNFILQIIEFQQLNIKKKYRFQFKKIIVILEFVIKLDIN